MLLGLFSLETLDYIDGVSAEIRDRWLQSTRLLGDLNNFTSDFRAAEGAILLASSADDAAADAKSLADLDASIARARRSYETIPHDADERDRYTRFASAWQTYRQIADRVVLLSQSGRKPAAIDLYRGASRSAYDTASDTLGWLTDRSVAAGGEARARAATAYRDARLLIIAAILLAGLVVAAAVSFIGRSLAQPLLALADSMHRLASSNLDIEIAETERGDEIGQMARTVTIFQANARELAISQRALAEQASMLEAQLEEEQRLAQLQRNFVAMASHEFRTPLTIIDGQAQRLIAMKEVLQPAELADRAGKIRSAVKRVTNVMENLLGSSRLLDGRGSSGLALHYAEFDLTQLLHEVCLLHREIAPRAQIRENFPSEPLLLVGDRSLLFQAYSNLVSNAIKYSPDGQLITIGIVSDLKEISVTIEDRGRGIPSDEISRLFERYYRGSNVSGTVGTGIGLYFVGLVVELHDGLVSVESIEGEGSRFAVRLPRSPARAKLELSTLG